MDSKNRRRTRIAAATSHQIETSRRIFETYLPGTTPMADAAIENLARRRARRREQK